MSRYYQGSGLTREEVDGRLQKDEASPIKGIVLGLGLVTPFWLIVGWVVFGK